MPRPKKKRVSLSYSPYSIIIGINFRQWIDQTFGGPTSAGRQMGISAPTFYDYFKGKTLPGGEMLKRCLQFGLDINWLYGVNSSNIKEPVLHYKNTSKSIRAEKIKKLDSILNEIKKNNPNYHKITLSQTQSLPLINIYFEITSLIQNDYKLNPPARLNLLKEIYFLLDMPLQYFRDKIEKLLTYDD